MQLRFRTVVEAFIMAWPELLVGYLNVVKVYGCCHTGQAQPKAVGTREFKPGGLVLQEQRIGEMFDSGKNLSCQIRTSDPLIYAVSNYSQMLYQLS